MITEDYVSFETAKLLKEKRFDEIVNHCYDLYSFEFISHCAKHGGQINAPTIQMAMKWLREKHNLVIQIELIDFLEHGEVWLYSVIERKTIIQLTGRDEDFTEHSYEEACEAAIRYCLENLI